MSRSKLLAFAGDALAFFGKFVTFLAAVVAIIIVVGGLAVGAFILACLSPAAFVFCLFFVVLFVVVFAAVWLALIARQSPPGRGPQSS